MIQTTRLETSKLLKEAGFKQENASYFFIDGTPAHISEISCYNDLIIDGYDVQARFTTDELLAELPRVVMFDGEEHWLSIRRINKFRVFYYYYQHDDICYLRMLEGLSHIEHESLPEALARMWLWLKKEGLL